MKIIERKREVWLKREWFGIRKCLRLREKKSLRVRVKERQKK